ncbi:MAG: aminotransferase class V-fold PLP-dependent enzyme [Chthoniobacterales bacterium]
MIEPDEIIFFDNNATTQLDPRVVEEMLPFLSRYFGNPSSGYRFASQVRDAIELARSRVAGLLQCEPEEIIFTSGGTESNNAALNSATQLDPARRHIVTTSVEHSAVRKHCAHLAGCGCSVSTVDVNGQGELDLGVLQAALRPDTAIISAMWANNETGVIFPVAEIARMARAEGVFFHTDAIQAAGKVEIDLRDSPINFLSISGHKLHGPKGVGALYINRRSAFRPSFFGGSHENDRRAGTENVAGIVGFGKAAELASEGLRLEQEEVRGLRDRFESAMLKAIPGAAVNGARTVRLPNTTSISFPGVDAGAALLLLDQRGVCCSAGSACRTASLESSHVLRAMRLSDEAARGSLRFSFGRYNTGQEIERGIQIVAETIAKLRRLSAPPAAASVV